MDQEILKTLNSFLGRAALKTYAGGGVEVDPEEAGFKELEYREGDWFYKDSYTGFFQSWGRETVWFKNKPIWTQLYGGGMVADCRDNEAFAHETFNFLKKALSAGEKEEVFQPRGPREFTDGDWLYSCQSNGDITNFSGHEQIFFKGRIVFIHDFLGGLILAR
jgi:hypothetical protein